LDALSDLLTRHGLSIVFAAVWLRQSGLPLPASPILVIAGALVADGTISVLALALAVVAASLLGDTPWYLAGRRYGYRVLRTLCRMALEPDSCVKQTESIFSRWGAASLMVAKYIPGFSTVAPPLAGAMRLAWWRFVAYSAVAALLWAALPVAGGAFFRREVEWLLGELEALGTGAIVVLAFVLGLYVAAKAAERFLLIRFLRGVRVTPEELHDLIASGSAPLILDVRAPLARELAPARIPGAVVVDLDTAEDALASASHERDVVVYCS
jgi:membrane protein DedA with SNARE-associated domain